ncbi:MAG TPA: hypothetical protein VGJ26_19425 [Pirellulales bacterium]|jgi:hypothetical protein
MNTYEPKHAPNWRGFRRWMMVSLLCAIAMPLLIASYPEHVGKGSYANEYHYDPYDSLRMLGIFAAMFVSGAAFGAAIGSVKGDQITLAIVGIFAWPVIFFCIGVMQN